MGSLSSEDITKYTHSPAHYAIARRDYSGLRRIISALPRLAKAGEIRTETDAIAEEHRAEALAAVIDRRDVPGRETPLHLAVRMGDVIAAEILMSSGADWSLQNEQGWSALQEAICAREEAIARVIMRYYQPLAWAKWCRRLPRVIATMQRMRDFYMEVTFHFESSVIPFIGRIAPSDTYRLWKQGSNLRADMTLAGFDGFRIQRCDQSFLFLGEGSSDGKLPPGSLCMLNHKEKEIMNALEGAGNHPTEAETAQEVAAMSQTNMYRPGIDVTQALLVPQLSWRRQEKTEMVGPWKTKVYEMHNVQVSVKSRRVPGAMTDEELFGSGDLDGELDEGYAELLTEDEKKQLETALRMESTEAEEDIYSDGRAKLENRRRSTNNAIDSAPRLSSASAFDVDPKADKKGWFGWGRKSVKQEDPLKKVAPPRSSVYVDEKESADALPRRSFKQDDFPRKLVPHRSSVCGDEKVSNLLGDDARKASRIQRGRQSVDARPSNFRADESFLSKKAGQKEQVSNRRRRVTPPNDGSGESEYKKGLRPVLWLTPHFPLKTEEMLPLLDILANKVKAIRRLRELLTTKLPAGTFPVKVAIPVVPTIRVIVTFNKFEELRSNEEFATPPCSPDQKGKEGGSSWFSWIKGSATKVAGMSGAIEEHIDDAHDPFTIPTDYAWTSMDAKKRKNKDRKSRRKAKRLPQEGGELGAES